MSTSLLGRDERDRDPLLKRLGALPASIEPGRDLWPGIAARIAAERQSGAPRRSGLSWQWAVAAGVGIAAVSALFTWFVVTPPTQVFVLDAPVSVLPQRVSFDRHAQFGTEYVATRARLLEAFRERLGQLPPETRARVEQDLAVIQRAVDDIDAALAQDPASQLLNQLLLSTLQEEINFYANVAGAPTGGAERT